MRRVILETPFAGDVERNRSYAVKCMRDCLLRGEAPFASHLLYTQALNDFDPKQREIGMTAGFAWRETADATIVYDDLGISSGMQRGIDHAKRIGQLIEFRKLDKAQLASVIVS